MADLIVYGTHLSPFVRKVEAVLGHVGEAYEFVEVGIAGMPDWFLQISPARRIPVLRDKSIATEGVDGTIPDSSAICLFLDRKFSAGLYGGSPFEAGRVVWLEEYADAVIAQPLGMELFRPLLFPRLRGEESDIATARQTWRDRLPRFFDYLEASLDGRAFFVGDRYSIADIAVGCQMLQLDLVAGLPDAAKWPALVRHTQATRERPGMAENLAHCRRVLSRLLPGPIDLN